MPESAIKFGSYEVGAQTTKDDAGTTLTKVGFEAISMQIRGARRSATPQWLVTISCGWHGRNNITVSLRIRWIHAY